MGFELHIESTLAIRVKVAQCGGGGGSMVLVKGLLRSMSLFRLVLTIWRAADGGGGWWLWFEVVGGGCWWSMYMMDRLLSRTSRRCRCVTHVYLCGL